MRTIHRILTNTPMILDAEALTTGLVQFSLHQANSYEGPANSDEGPLCGTCSEPVEVTFAVGADDLTEMLTVIGSGPLVKVPEHVFLAARHLDEAEGSLHRLDSTDRAAIRTVIHWVASQNGKQRGFAG